MFNIKNWFHFWTGVTVGLIIYLVLITSVSFGALVRDWEFEEGTGAVAFDTIHFDTITLSGTTSWVSGKVGSYALNIGSDGSGLDTIAVSPDTGGTGGLSTMTIKFWVKFDAWDATVNTLYSVSNGIQNTVIYFKQTVGYFLMNGHTDNVACLNLTGLPAMSTGAWYRVVFTLDSAADATYWRNGVEMGHIACVNLPIYDIPSQTISSWFRYGGANNFTLNGTIDNMTIEDVCYSSAEVMSDWSGTPPPDTTPPVISGVSATSISSTTATILWTTDESANSQIDYGLTTSYGSSTALDTDFVTSHSETIRQLADSTTYHYRVKSMDVSSNTATGTDNTFSTYLRPPDTTPPVIFNVTVDTITCLSASIRWITDKATTGRIHYGLDDNYGSTSTIISSYISTHTITLDGLARGTTYHFRTVCVDTSANTGYGTDSSFVSDYQPIPDSVATVRDGTGTDILSTKYRSLLEANWDASSGAMYYKYALGTVDGATDVRDWTNCTGSSWTASILYLTDGATYYFSVKASSGGGDSSLTSSNGQYIQNSSIAGVNGLVARWKFNEGTGNYSKEEVSQTTGTFNSGGSCDTAKWITSFNGSSGFEFDPTHICPYFLQNNISYPVGNSSYTFTGWFYDYSVITDTWAIGMMAAWGGFSEQGGDMVVCGMSNGIFPPSGYDYNPNFLNTWYIDHNGDPRYVNPYMSRDNWHFVAFEYNGNDLTNKIYLDGSTTPVVDEYAGEGGYAVMKYGSVYIGSWGWYMSDYLGFKGFNFKGKIDECKMFDTALSTTEISKIYNYDNVTSSAVYYVLILKRNDLQADSLWETGDIVSQIAEQDFHGWGDMELNTDLFATTKIIGSTCCYRNCLMADTTMVYKNREYQVYLDSVTPEMTCMDFCNSINKKSLP
jgi:hypothetical protein